MHSEKGESHYTIMITGAWLFHLQCVTEMHFGTATLKNSVWSQSGSSSFDSLWFVTFCHGFDYCYINHCCHLLTVWEVSKAPEENLHTLMDNMQTFQTDTGDLLAFRSSYFHSERLESHFGALSLSV